MSEHTDPLWETHCTPMRCVVNRCEVSELRSEISTAFYLMKRGLFDTPEDAMEQIGKYWSRPDVTKLMNMGRNFSKP